MAEAAMSQVVLSWQLRLILSLERWMLPLWRWTLQKRLKKGKESHASYQQKLMLVLPSFQRAEVQSQPLIWGHAVGVGEVLALLGLFRRLSEHFPDHHFLLTSTSRTSGEALARQRLPSRVHHQFAPIDHPAVLSRFLDAWQPKIACWSETDLWPGMVCATRERGIPMLMFNARLSQAKGSRMKRLAWFYQPLFHCFDRVYAQNAASKALLVKLFPDVSLAQSAGNIKALAPALQFSSSDLQTLQSMWEHRPVWLLASSHPGEEEIALQAHHKLRQAHSRALLIVVPRDAFRGAEIADLVLSHGMTAGMRSSKVDGVAGCDVYIADTMGELGLWYAFSSVAFVGGSLVPIGGHNPYEAIAARCSVISGVMTDNFAESYTELQSTGLAVTATDAVGISQAVLHAWQAGRALAHTSTGEDLLQAIVLEMQQQAPTSVG